MSCGNRAERRARRVLVAALSVWAIRPGRAAAESPVDEGWRAPTSAEIALVGPERALAAVREVTGELLSRDGMVVSWRQLDWLRAEDILETGIGLRGAPMFVWIDLSSTVEARLYFRAAAGQRFVIRRFSLPGRVGPVEVEEIAQIVQSVLRALASDSTWALSLSEARVALRTSERPAPVVAGAAARRPSVEVGSAVIGQRYAPELAFTGEVEVSIAVLSRPAGPARAAFPGTVGGGFALGYGWPARFSNGPVGADLQATTLRLELVWEPLRAGRWAAWVGAGGGADWVTFTPRAESPGAVAAAAGSFLGPLACLSGALHLEISPRFALALGFLAQVYLKRVHFDVSDPSGGIEEVLVPHRLRPALTLGAEVRL